MKTIKKSKFDQAVDEGTQIVKDTLEYLLFEGHHDSPEEKQKKIDECVSKLNNVTNKHGVNKGINFVTNE